MSTLVKQPIQVVSSLARCPISDLWDKSAQRATLMLPLALQLNKEAIVPMLQEHLASMEQTESTKYANSLLTQSLTKSEIPLYYLIGRALSTFCNISDHTLKRLLTPYVDISSLSEESIQYIDSYTEL